MFWMVNITDSIEKSHNNQDRGYFVFQNVFHWNTCANATLQHIQVLFTSGISATTIFQHLAFHNPAAV